MKRAILLLFLLILCIAGFLTVNGMLPLVPIFGASMAPTLQSGSLLTINAVNPDDIKVGDIIIYNVPTMAQKYYNYPPIIAHRVVAIETVPSTAFRTRGDNAGDDPFTVKPTDIRGTVGKQIPYLGLPLRLFQSPQGLILVILGLAVLTFIFFIREILSGGVKTQRPIFLPVNKEEKLDRRALTRKKEATEKKTAEQARAKAPAAIPEKPQPQPEKAAEAKVKPLPAAPKSPVSPGGAPKREGLTEDALAAEKEIFSALDRLHNKLNKPKDQV